MTQEQGNKIIAEFMGWKIEYVTRQNSVYPSRMVYEVITVNPSGETVQAAKFHDNERIKDVIAKEWRLLTDERIGRVGKYHSSWDWLMPACHKWDNLTDAEIIEGTWPEYERLSDILDAKITLYEILPVWEQLVKNLQWYNNQTTQS